MSAECPDSFGTASQTKDGRGDHLMKVGVSALVLPSEWSFSETLEKIRSLGYEALEPVIRDQGEITPDTSDDDLRKLADLAREAGIELVSTCPAITSMAVNLLTDDEEYRQSSMAMTRKMLRVTGALGIDAMLHTLAWPGDEPYYDVMYAQGIKSLKELVPACQEYGVRIAVEFVWNKFLNSPLEMRQFLDEVGSPWVGFYFDPGNMSMHGWAHHWARICGKHILKVHAKDFKFEWPTVYFPALLEGDVKWPKVMAELRAIGFDGALTSETPESEAPLDVTAEAIRKIMSM